MWAKYIISLVDPADATRLPLQDLLLVMDGVYLDSACNRYEFFLDAVALARPAPDVAIVSLDADSNMALQLIKKTREAYPRQAILALSDSPALLQQALEFGVEDILRLPLDKHALTEKIHGMFIRYPKS
jgi:DNA-binding NarL/FixJ family response regulator